MQPELAMWAAMAVMLTAGGSCGGSNDSAGGPSVVEPTVTPAAGVPAFPLRVAASGRYLEDQRGEPFFVNGDTPWSLTHNLTYEEAVRYLEDRRAKGFNALIVSVPDAYGPDGEHDDPPDRQGNRPFIGNDISRPNEPYWSHVDRVLASAEERGFLVLLFPFYLGCCSDGYAQLFAENGMEKAREYGRFVGRRYAGRRNVFYVHGGDSGPGDGRDLVAAVKAGILEAGGAHLHATHWQAENDPAAPFGADFMDLYGTYTYRPVAALVSRHYAASPTKPVVLMETHYENDWGHRTADDVRLYPYQAVLSGAAGHFFGNRPLWFCGHGWEAALNSPGSRAMSHVAALFRSRPWHALVPDREGRLVVAGRGDPLDGDGVPAAVAADGSVAMALLPARRTIGVDLGRMNAETVRVSWFDAVTGAAHDAGTFPARGSLSLTPPGDGPAVLVLDDVRRGLPLPGQQP